MLSRSYKLYALGALTAVYTLNFVDRYLMTLLMQPIKEDLQLSDTQLGFLTGIAFGLFYATVGVPIARWADRGNRVVITSAAIGLWGLTVMACVFVTNYVQLVLARIAAAVGESGCKPPTYSLLGDYFADPAHRTRAMAIYLSGSSLSAMVSMVAGGWLNEHHGWRMTFLLMGIPGLLLAVLIKLTIKEPRTQVSGPLVQEPALPSIKTVLTLMWRQRSCRHLCVAVIVLYTLGLGLSPWYGAFMIRSHGMGTQELGLWLGMIFSVGGMAGVLIGGFICSRMFASNERGQMRLSAVMVALLVPFFVAFLTLENKFHALMALTPLMIIWGFFLGPTYALMQRLVPDGMRATMMSVVMLLANLIGMGIGPQIVGILSDLFAPFAGADSLRYAMLMVACVALWGAWHFWQVGRTVEGDLATAAQRVAG